MIRTEPISQVSLKTDFVSSVCCDVGIPEHVNVVPWSAFLMSEFSDTTTSSKPGAQSAYLDLSEKNETKYTARSPRRPGLDRRNPGQTN
eukprot:c17424_g1_i3 orf=392-658(+)